MKTNNNCKNMSQSDKRAKRYPYLELLLTSDLMILNQCLPHSFKEHIYLLFTVTFK